MNKVEILSPAGNLDTLKMAINSGANACYLGLQQFSARSFAQNFSHEEFIEAIRYAHLRNAKIYVTLNTLYNEYEINNVIKEIDFLYHHNVDAILIQDLGLLNIVSSKYPELPLHISTQMHVHNPSCIAFLKQFPSVKRVVLARETPLSVVKECVKEGLEVEIFAYGALCVSYSGQCLASSFTKHRSGNKGMCAQNCRMIWQVSNKNTTKVIADDKYLLSMKDLNIINDLPALLDLGISSIKIEGRMKRSEYVVKVVECFKQAIDAYYNNTSYQLSKTDLKELKLLYNRQFTNGLLNSANKGQLFNQERPNHMGIVIGKVVSFNHDLTLIKLYDNLNQNDGLRIIQKKDIGISCNYIYKDGLLVNSAKADDIIGLKINDYVEKDAIVVKTTDYLLHKRLNSYAQEFHYRLPIDMYFEANINKPMKLIVKQDKYTVEVSSELIVQKALKTPTSKNRIIEQLSKVNDSVYYVNHIDGECDDIFFSIKAINDLRKLALNKLDKIRLESYRYPNSKEYEKLDVKENKQKYKIVEIFNETQLPINDALVFTSDINLAHKYDLYISDLIVNENADYPCSEFRLVKELGGLTANSRKIANYSLNVTNSYALELLLACQVECVILSVELDNQMIEELIKNFKLRHGFMPSVAILNYGKIDMMNIKGDFNYDININYNDMRINDFQNNTFDIYVDKANIKHLYPLENTLKSDINLANKYYRFVDEDKDFIENIL